MSPSGNKLDPFRKFLLGAKPAPISTCVAHIKWTNKKPVWILHSVVHTSTKKDHIDFIIFNFDVCM